MSEQQEAVAGTSSRRLPYAAPIYNCLKLWAFQLNSTLAAAACCRPHHPGRLRGRTTDMTRRPARELLPIPGSRRVPKRIFRSWQTTPVLPDESTASPPEARPPCAKKKALRQRDLATVHGVVFAILATACSCAGPLSQKPRDNPLKKCRIRQNREERHV
jgi:hypothetical protein